MLDRPSHDTPAAPKGETHRHDGADTDGADTEDIAPLRPAPRHVHKALKHDSAHLHVAGQARYVDDIPEPGDMLHLYLAMSTRAHATITAMDLDAVRSAPGVVTVLTADDVPGVNNVGPVIKDDPLFAEGKVFYHGQCLFAVVAETLDAARAAAALATIAYDDRPALITIDDAMAAGAVVEDVQTMARGDAQSALANAPHTLSGSLALGGQDHFYLEGQVALAFPGEDGAVHVHSSTQNPTEVQHLVADVLGTSSALVTVELRRMGGGFGGKETQPAIMAAAAAIAATKTGRPVKCRLDRDDDMIMTGKRHDFQTDYQLGYGEDGRITAARVSMATRCGYSTDLSMAICDRAMFHTDNAYFLPDVEILSHRLRTNTVSNTAFRGFGGPQGMVGIERAMDHLAFQLGQDPLDVRLANLYSAPQTETAPNHGVSDGRDITPYHQRVKDNVAREIMLELAQSADYRARRAAINAFNAESPVIKKGIALTPVKFGISFTVTHLNQAGALVHIYADGSVQLNHGGTEMGQGLMVKVAQVVADELGIGLDNIRITATTTDKVPNTSATAASSGTDLNGMAARNAAITLRDRMAEVAATHWGTTADKIVFDAGTVGDGTHTMAFKSLAKMAYLQRVQLSATGFYKTPDIHYDRKTHTGNPFYYFAYGAAVSEVAIDTLTGENKTTRVDILHDVGRSLNPAIDLGQIEGGFIQGMGWLTTEELVFDDTGRLRTHAPSTYKIPVASDRPEHFAIDIWQPGKNASATIHRSKAVGEPPFMLAISVFSALTHAVSAAANHAVFPNLDAPATPERVLMAVMDARRRAGLG